MMAKSAKSVATDWSAAAKGLLRSEMTRRGVSYSELVDRLAAIGVEESEANLRNKVSRGSFSAAFLVQCLVVMDVRSLALDHLIAETDR